MSSEKNPPTFGRLKQFFDRLKYSQWGEFPDGIQLDIIENRVSDRGFFSLRFQLGGFERFFEVKKKSLVLPHPAGVHAKEMSWALKKHR